MQHLNFCKMKISARSQGGLSMNSAEPIKKANDLSKLKNYYKEIHPNPRNELLIILGLNTALRISDILALKWEDVYDFEWKEYKKHIHISEQKTGKTTQIYMNHNVQEALYSYKSNLKQKKQTIEKDRFLFSHSNKNVPISRTQAFRIIKNAADYYKISGVISCHSLRKTFGYHAWKQGASPVVLVEVFNHSSYQVTKHYLGIEQEDKDKIFQKIKL